MKKNSSGYSLIELLTVVTIIGILAAIALPNYRGYRDKAKKVTVITTLRQIRLAEEVYWSDFKHYFPIDVPIIDATSKITISGLDMDIPLPHGQQWSISAIGAEDDAIKVYLVRVKTRMDANFNGISDQYTFSRTSNNGGSVISETEIYPLRPDAGT